MGIGQNSCPAALLYHPMGYSAVVRSSVLENNALKPTAITKVSATDVEVLLENDIHNSFLVHAACTCR